MTPDAIQVFRLARDGKSIYVLGEKMTEDSRLYAKFWRHFIHWLAEDDTLMLEEIDSEIILWGYRERKSVDPRAVWDLMLKQISEKYGDSDPPHYVN